MRHLGQRSRSRVLNLAGVRFGFLVGSYGVGLFLPQIIKLGNLSNREVGLVSSACYIVATIGWLAGQRRSTDARQDRQPHAGVPRVGHRVRGRDRLIEFLGLADRRAGRAHRHQLHGGIFWTIPPRFLTGLAAAGGLAFINSIGTMGGFVGPYVMGWLTDRTGSFNAGLAAMSVFLLIATGLSWSLGGSSLR